MRFDRMILLGLAMLSAAPASAQMISARNPQTLVSYLQSKGYRAELVKDGDGTRIRSGAGGTQFVINFENCAEGANCTTVSFFSGYTDFDNVPLSRINEWNRVNRFARAFIDAEGDPVLVMDVDLDHAGIPAANFGEYVDIYGSLASKYLTYLRGE